MDSQNVISYKDSFIDEVSRSLCIVMEYAESGDLYSQIEKHVMNGTRFEEEEIWKVLIHIVKGLVAIHNLSVMHRDLKSANVFMFKDFQAKLGDFNVSKVMKMGLEYTQTGTPYYASPEVWKDKPYGPTSDIWSLGVVIYEMTELVPPFKADSMDELYTQVLEGKYKKINKRYSRELSFVLRSLLQVQPSKRPDASQIL